jgi:hypothetical protein
VAPFSRVTLMLEVEVVSFAVFRELQGHGGTYLRCCSQAWLYLSDPPSRAERGGLDRLDADPAVRFQAQPSR